jgi:hypothetical protein
MQTSEVLRTSDVRASRRKDNAFHPIRVDVKALKSS